MSMYRTHSALPWLLSHSCHSPYLSTPLELCQGRATQFPAPMHVAHETHMRGTHGGCRGCQGCPAPCAKKFTAQLCQYTLWLAAPVASSCVSRFARASHPHAPTFTYLSSHWLAKLKLPAYSCRFRIWLALGATALKRFGKTPLDPMARPHDQTRPHRTVLDGTEIHHAQSRAL